MYIKDMKGMVKHMDVLNFQISKPLQFNWTGKFIAPDETGHTLQGHLRIMNLSL